MSFSPPSPSLPQRVLDETNLEKWGKLCAAIAKARKQTAGKESSPDEFARWLQDTVAAEEAAVFANVDPTLRRDLHNRLMSMLPGNVSEKRSAPQEWEEPQQAKRPRTEREEPQQHPATEEALFQDDDSDQPAQHSQHSQQSRDDDEPQTQVRQYVNVACPVSTRLAGVYALQKGSCHGCCFWKHTTKDYYLFSSRMGLWTISNRDGMSNGVGAISARISHGGHPPYDPAMAYQYVKNNKWCEHDGIVITPCEEEAKETITLEVLRKFLSADGHLTRKGCGRLLRYINRDVTQASPTAETWQTMCQSCGTAGLELTLPEACHLVGIAPPPPPPPPPPSAPSAPSAPTEAKTAAYRTTSTAKPVQNERCGRCRACKNPKWKKACEARHPVSSHVRPSAAHPLPTKPRTDVVADLIGAQPLALQKQKPTPGYAYGVKLTDVVNSKK